MNGLVAYLRQTISRKVGRRPAYKPSLSPEELFTRLRDADPNLTFEFAVTYVNPKTGRFEQSIERVRIGDFRKLVGFDGRYATLKVPRRASWALPPSQRLRIRLPQPRPSAWRPSRQRVRPGATGSRDPPDDEPLPKPEGRAERTAA